jgi:hypothetical protein
VGLPLRIIVLLIEERRPAFGTTRFGLGAGLKYQTATPCLQQANATVQWSIQKPRSEEGGTLELENGARFESEFAWLVRTTQLDTKVLSTE